MTFLEAAMQVLKANRWPMTTREILEQMREQGLLETHGKTPSATLSATLFRALATNPHLGRDADPGPTRSSRGSVRWFYLR
jgi:HB1, ASXL, restriction endonuclease HTH domain